MEIAAKRLKSLDLFRGLTVAGMILVNSPGNETAYWPLDHAEWNGLTPTDLVFPFFMFIVGMSLVFSLRRRKTDHTSNAQLFKTILRRTLILFGLGLFLNGFPYYHLSTIRIPGVLQRIALGYFFGSILFLLTSTRTQIILAVTTLVGYWLLMTHVPVPGFGAGDLSKEGNLAAYLDRIIFQHHMYRPVYDPEGFLSTFPSIVSVLTGIWTAMYALKENPILTLRRLYLAGLVCLAAGVAWHFHFPINKALWTSSFVLVTSGLALLCFALLYQIVDVHGWKNGGKPFEALGQNAIAAYVAHIFFLKVQNLIHMPRPNGSPGNLRFFITDHVFAPWLSAKSASAAYGLVYTGLWLCVFTVLSRRKIILKI
jgi:predicted acyltransferase